MRYILSRNFSSAFDRSAHMKLLHSQGRYTGVSKIGIWNSSEEKKQHMADIYARNALDKTSHGYGSEYAQRLRNRELLHNKLQGESGFLYFIEFPGSVKVGFSKNWERRMAYELYPKKTHLGGKVIMIISGPTGSLGDLEFETLTKFSDYTQLNSDKTRYTEFLDKSAKLKIKKYLMSEVSKRKDLKIEVH